MPKPISIPTKIYLIPFAHLHPHIQRELAKWKIIKPKEQSYPACGSLVFFGYEEGEHDESYYFHKYTGKLVAHSSMLTQFCTPPYATCKDTNYFPPAEWTCSGDTPIFKYELTESFQNTLEHIRKIRNNTNN